MLAARCIRVEKKAIRQRESNQVKVGKGEGKKKEREREREKTQRTASTHQAK